MLQTSLSNILPYISTFGTTEQMFRFKRQMLFTFYRGLGNMRCHNHSNHRLLAVDLAWRITSWKPAKNREIARIPPRLLLRHHSPYFGDSLTSLKTEKKRKRGACDM